MAPTEDGYHNRYELIYAKRTATAAAAPAIMMEPETELAAPMKAGDEVLQERLVKRATRMIGKIKLT